MANLIGLCCITPLIDYRKDEEKMTNAISKRILAFALAIATVIAFTPAIAFTQSVHAGTANSTITIGNVAFTTDASGNTVYGTTNNSGDVTNTGSTSTNYNIMWDGSTLTFNSAKIYVNSRQLISRSGDMNIVLNGDSTIGSPQLTSTDKFDRYGIYCTGNMTVSGKGKMTVQAQNTITNGSSNYDSIGIYCTGDFTVNSGTIISKGNINTNCKGENCFSRGISCKNFILNGGDVTSIGMDSGAEGTDGNSEGICCDNDFTINDGIFTGESALGDYSHGIECTYGNFTANGGTVTATAGKSKTYGSSWGIDCFAGLCNVRNSTVTATGGITVSGNGSLGIVCKSFDSTNSEVKATGSAATFSYGIDSSQTVKITDSSVQCSGETNAIYLDGQTTSATISGNVTAYTATDTAGTTGITQYTSGTALPTDAKFFKATYIPPVYPPSITTQPTGGSYDIGGTVTPLKVATSDTGAKYQWQQSTDGTNWTNIEGATNPTYTPSAGASGSTKYRCLITGSNGASTYSDAVTITVSTKYAIPAKGTIKAVNGFEYEVTKIPTAAKTVKASATTGCVKLVKETAKHKTASIPSYITINNYRFYVTSVSGKALYKDASLKTVTLGSRITGIGSKAFYGCKNLKTVTITTRSLKTVGSKAFKKCRKGMTFKIPKTKYKAYKKLLKGKVPAGTKYKKI